MEFKLNKTSNDGAIIQVEQKSFQLKPAALSLQPGLSIPTEFQISWSPLKALPPQLRIGGTVHVQTDPWQAPAIIFVLFQ